MTVYGEEAVLPRQDTANARGEESADGILVGGNEPRWSGEDSPRRRPERCPAEWCGMGAQRWVSLSPFFICIASMAFLLSSSTDSSG
ncbi:MAG: hypothetical protein K8R12_05350, partial [Desulfobacterales bacterium]|nr:hypothetical protein [Desulfobacterales bacterium]